MVKSANNIVSVGEKCFAQTYNLKQASFIPNLTNIGSMAFLCSDVEYDWSTLLGCTFGTDATPLQYNPTNFWDACTVTPCENRLPTFLCQDNPQWVDRQIGTSGFTYDNGCMLMCLIHAYCGLHDLELSSVTEFEDIANAINPNLLNSYTTSSSSFKSFADNFATVEQYTAWDQTVLQTVYDALADGKYAIVTQRGQSNSLSHTVLLYGINENGEFLVADSETYFQDDKSIPIKYTLPYHKITGYASEYPILWIVSA